MKPKDMELKRHILREQIRLTQEIGKTRKLVVDLEEVHRLTPLYVGVMYYVQSVGRVTEPMLRREMELTVDASLLPSLPLVLASYLKLARLRKEGDWILVGRDGGLPSESASQVYSAGRLGLPGKG